VDVAEAGHQGEQEVGGGADEHEAGVTEALGGAADQPDVQVGAHRPRIQDQRAREVGQLDRRPAAGQALVGADRVQHGPRVQRGELLTQLAGARPHQVGAGELRPVDVVEGLALVAVGWVGGAGVPADHRQPDDAAAAEPAGQRARERVRQAVQHQQRPGERQLPLQHRDGAVERGLVAVAPGRWGEQEHAVFLEAAQPAELALHVLLPARVAEAAAQLGGVDRRLDVEEAGDPRVARQRPAEQLVAPAVQAPVVEGPGLEHVVAGLLPLLLRQSALLAAVAGAHPTRTSGGACCCGVNAEP
jgi:hypothetical protein